MDQATARRVVREKTYNSTIHSPFRSCLHSSSWITVKSAVVVATRQLAINSTSILIFHNRCVSIRQLPSPFVQACSPIGRFKISLPAVSSAIGRHSSRGALLAETPVQQGGGGVKTIGDSVKSPHMSPNDQPSRDGDSFTKLLIQIYDLYYHFLTMVNIFDSKHRRLVFYLSIVITVFPGGSTFHNLFVYLILP